ncbi:hypothetical protein OUZ56_026644 [Daphnia magna]|uniref:Uncharacterized protein n=1 Tax=Daphnia magna TaxID=35525 RepID=A0ABQ9ZMD5_9CRUS|nr:hypothetical protein OUZ56_026644 [Daphnia magna]
MKFTRPDFAFKGGRTVVEVVSRPMKLDRVVLLVPRVRMPSVAPKDSGESRSIYLSLSST